MHILLNDVSDPFATPTSAYSNTSMGSMMVTSDSLQSTPSTTPHHMSDKHPITSLNTSPPTTPVVAPTSQQLMSPTVAAEITEAPLEVQRQWLLLCC